MGKPAKIQAKATVPRRSAAPRRRSPYGWLTPNQAIPLMVKRIVKQFDTERIILFGSQARGNAGPDSDVDLLVVMEVESSKRDLEVQIRVALHGIRIPKDILVTTPGAYAWRKKYTGTIEHPAATEGKFLYARK